MKRRPLRTQFRKTIRALGGSPRNMADKEEWSYFGAIVYAGKLDADPSCKAEMDADLDDFMRSLPKRTAALR